MPAIAVQTCFDTALMHCMAPVFRGAVPHRLSGEDFLASGIGKPTRKKHIGLS